jgi:hypothetical protein
VAEDAEVVELMSARLHLRPQHSPHPLLLVFFFALAAACSRHLAPDPGGPRITLQVPTQTEPALVTVTGLGGQDLSSLRDARLTADQWQALLNVTVRDTALDALSRPPVQGRYAVTSSAITFTPIYPFDPGRAYDVIFNRSQLPGAQASAPVAAVVQLPAVAGSPSTTVTAVYPSAEPLPENTLRLYIEFSAPMGNAGALEFVRLSDDRGRPVDIPF